MGFIARFFKCALPHGIGVKELFVSGNVSAIFLSMTRLAPGPTLFPYTTLFRSDPQGWMRCLITFCHPEVVRGGLAVAHISIIGRRRSEEHTSELQSPM